MHIAEGFLPPLHAALWCAVSAPFVVHGARAVIAESRSNPESRLLLAAATAFTFVLSAFKLPSIAGTSSHPTGTGAGAVLFRPPVMAFLGTLVLLFQALLLAHGGLTTLGANVFSMAIAGPWVGYALYRALRRLHAGTAVFAALAGADLTTYVVASVQLALAYPDPETGLAGSLARFLAVFAVTQIPLALAEGIAGVLLLRYLARVAAPELERRGLLTPTPESSRA